eukprot:TRINITY_DN3260_c0_g1_i1.p2 TRINITY_DN3260_c0_g1~~TRINITY_DN3260_c0_g1_i1.p2  ORF type:complete len:307 (-),score=72.49 TRINITY_DN3260_c0_g1_i1:3265-4185(-)
MEARVNRRENRRSLMISSTKDITDVGGVTANSEDWNQSPNSSNHRQARRSMMVVSKPEPPQESEQTTSTPEGTRRTRRDTRAFNSINENEEKEVPEPTPEKIVEEEEDDSLSEKEDEVEEVGNEGEETEQKKSSSWITRKKKGVASSAVGRALFNQFVDKETKLLIKHIALLVEKDQGKKFAKKIDNDIFKIAVKAAVLYEQKSISTDDFLHLRNSFRRICSATRNGYRSGSGKLSESTAQRIAEMLHAFANGVKQVISPHLSKKTVLKIDDLMEYIGSADFLVRMSKFVEFDKVVYVLAYYLQET